MKKIIFFITIILLTSCSLFQKKSTSSSLKETTLGVPIEISPEYPGGFTEMMKFLAKNIVYPQEAKENGIQGKVYAEFVVRNDGSLSDIKIVRGIGELCDQEVIRVLKLMPKWTPGKQKGKKVHVRFTLPVKFTLTDPVEKD